MPSTRLQRLLSNVAAAYTNMGVGAACSLIAVPLYVRFLGKEEYGLWLVILSLLWPLTIMALGFPTVTQNILAEAHAHGDWVEAKRVLATGFTLLAVSTLSGCALAVILAHTGILVRLLKTPSTLQCQALLVVLISIGGYALAQPLQVFRMALRAFERVDLEQRGLSLQAILNLLVVVVVLVLGGRLVAVAIAYAAVQVLSGGFFVLYVRRKFPRLGFSFAHVSKAVALAMLAPGFHFFILSLSGVLIWGMDNIVISAVLGVVFVTAFAIASRLTSILRGIVATLFTTMTPTITTLHAEKRAETLRRMLAVSTKLAMGMALLLGIELGFFGRNFIALWAGKQVVVDQATFWSLTGVLAVNVFTQPAFFLIVATSKHKTYSYLCLAEGALNLALSYWWVHVWGVRGVALGTLVSQIVFSGVYLPWAGMRIVALPLLRTLPRSLFRLLPPVLAGLLVALGTRGIAVNWGQWVLCSSATCAAFLLTYAALALAPEELDLLRNAFHWPLRELAVSRG
jgi:O-antigen/teichoic acid export membrane protein